LLSGGIQLEAELGGDHYLGADCRQRFTHQFFVDERPVDFGRVEERDAPIDRHPNQGEHGLSVGRRTVAGGHPQAAEPEGRHFEIAVAESALLHGSSTKTDPFYSESP
jgi:hypothetical protein